MRSILITGGAGFIGANAAMHFARQGWTVTLLDNLSRPGSERNLQWLRDRIDPGFVQTDIRDAAAVADAVRRSAPDLVIHLAAQVSVVSSVADPRQDFEVNALGTLNVLEALRAGRPEAFLINASTNKVYGALDRLATVEQAARHQLVDPPLGVDESQPLDFHSPYGCSKGAGDAYALDYARIFGIDATTFRQSCIYGPRQFGVEEQGWVAWFAIAAATDRPITLFGDGKQMRDVLHVSDLVRAYEAAYVHRERARGQAFNIGGGPDNTLSLIEMLELLGREMGRNIEVRHGPARPGDQLAFVCDTRKAQDLLGWRATVSPAAGVREMVRWVGENKALFRTGGDPASH